MSNQILLVFLFEYLLPNRACILNFRGIKERESQYTITCSQPFLKRKTKQKIPKKQTNKRDKNEWNTKLLGARAEAAQLTRQNDEALTDKLKSS